MAEQISVPKWEYQDKNIQGSIEQNDFTRADRVIIYTAPTPLPGQKSTAMKAIGLIQGMSVSEQKQLQTLFELGSAAPMIIPGLTQGQISMQRVLINGMNFLNTIYHGADVTNLASDKILRSIRDIDRPFDLMVAKYPVLDGSLAAQALETTLFRGCQIQARSESITAGGVVIFEQLNIVYTHVPKVTFKAVSAR
jgi:hypothetical protein